MYKCDCDIKIGSFKFYMVAGLKIEQSYRQLTSTANIVLPRRVEWKGKEIHLGDSGLIKAGDKVIIYLGYDGQMIPEYVGYVRKVGSGFPITIECEDEAYTLKQTDVKPKQFKQATLKKVLEYALPSGVFRGANIDDINLGEFIIYSDCTAAQVVQAIIDQYHLYAFFRKGSFYCGRPIWDDGQETHLMVFGRNIHDNHRLKFANEEDKAITVKAVSVLADNTKLEAVWPPKSKNPNSSMGTVHSVNVNFITNKADLEALAKRRYEALKKVGMNGTFDTFGRPSVKHGDIIDFRDKLETGGEREGKYVVESVTKEFGNGYTQTIKLGNRYEQ